MIRDDASMPLEAGELSMTQKNLLQLIIYVQDIKCDGFNHESKLNRRRKIPHILKVKI